MKLASNRRIELDNSEHRMLTLLCGYLTPPSAVVSLVQLRSSIDPVISVHPPHDMAAIAQELLRDLLREAEQLLERGANH